MFLSARTIFQKFSTSARDRSFRGAEDHRHFICADHYYAGLEFHILIIVMELFGAYTSLLS